MPKYINMGWLSERAIYIDSDDHQFYLSDIKKNSNGILLLAPVTGTVFGGAISAISSSLGATSAGFRWIILLTCCIVAFIASIIGVRLLWRKGNLSPYQPTAYQVRELLENNKHQRIGQTILILLSCIAILIVYFYYVYSGDLRSLMTATFFLGTILVLIWDTSPQERKKIIKQLEKEYY